MIEIMGSEGSSEYAVGRQIAKTLEGYWPGLSESPPDAEHLKILTNAKLSGYQVQDIDVIICAKFRSGRQFVPTKIVKDNKGRSVGTKPIGVKRLLVAIEVKDQDPSRIRYMGETDMPVAVMCSSTAVLAGPGARSAFRSRDQALPFPAPSMWMVKNNAAPCC